jgi:hypothetical protein
VKAWLLGRVASAEAAARLLADRADRGARDDLAPWPELAESNCFACHHQLLPEGWRTGAAQARGRGPGAPAWQTIWPVTRPEHLAALARAGALRPFVEQVQRELGGARKLVEVADVPSPNEARARAGAAATALGELRKAIQALPDRAAARAALDLYEGVSAGPFDWDEACQVVYGLAALERARRELAPPGERAANPTFALMFEQLALPRPARGVSYASPRGYDPSGLERELQSLLVSVRTAYRGVVK